MRGVGRSATWAWRTLISTALATFAVWSLSSCGAPVGSGPLSDTGYAVTIAVASQPVYAQSTCAGATTATVRAGDNVIDLGSAGTNCEQVIYARGDGFTGSGYLPIYGLRRAAGGVRCTAPVSCHLRAGPDTTYAAVGTLAPGRTARGYATGKTGAIITDGSNYSWWEVVDPASGQRSDVFGPNCQAY